MIDVGCPLNRGLKGLDALGALRGGNSPAMTLGRPMVSPGFAGCEVPTDRPERIGESSNRVRLSILSGNYTLLLINAGL
jgi:hypothetical protein